MTAAPGSPVHQVRLLIADLDTDNQLLDDDTVVGYLSMHGVTRSDATFPGKTPTWSVRRAAADALDAIATSEVLVSKVIRTAAGVVTDGAKVADALRKQAVALRAQADADAAAAAVDEADDCDLDVIEFAPYPRGRW